MEEALSVQTMWTICERLLISWLPLGPFMAIPVLVRTESLVQNELRSPFMCRIIQMIASRTKDTDAFSEGVCEGVCRLNPRNTLSDTRLFYLPDPMLFCWKLRNLHDNLVRVWATEHDYPRDLREVRHSAYCERDVSLFRSSLSTIHAVFAKWNRNSMNSANSGNRYVTEAWIGVQFKDPVSHMCLAGTVVVALWSLTQEVCRFELSFVTEFSENSTDFNES